MQTKGPCLEEILCPQTSQCFDSVPEKVGLLSFLYMCSFFCFNFHYLSKAFLVSLHFLFHCFVITKLICMLSHNHIVLFCITCFLLIACNPSSASSFSFAHYLCMLQQFWLRQYTTQRKDRAHPLTLLSTYILHSVQWCIGCTLYSPIEIQRCQSTVEAMACDKQDAVVQLQRNSNN